MTIATLAMIFAAGFVIMTPAGPVSSICIRRSLIYGRRAGIAAGVGDAVAVATYATIGVTGSTLLPRFFAPFATAWHIGIALVLVAAAILLWRTRPALPESSTPSRSTLAGGFATTLALALANPADIVLFAALFTGLGIGVQTPFEQAIFCATIFAGGCTYWIAVAMLLNRWRTGLTSGRIMWLNRACSTFMVVGAVASIVSLVRAA